MSVLNAEQIAAYHQDGYLHVPGLLTPEEASGFRQECHALAARLQEKRSIEATWASAREVTMVKTQLLHCHDVQYHAAAFSRLLVDPRLGGAAADLIGPNVQLHHNKMFIKPPEKGSPFPLHQDHPFFPHEQHSMLAVVLHFDDAPEEKGCLRVVPGSHKRGPIEHIETGSWHLSPEEYPLESAVAVPARAGDALFFSYLTIHGSGVNVSQEARTTWLIQLRRADDRPVVDSHPSPGQGMMLWGNS
ncbi:phytanoyl-CoA dioxygenase family protein [Deinococcus irradiatisoli]|uniref:Phytanoyl-CoA dioxygenase family protein n=1 Tax=Deinococcus irradiatisoli TaxID=2202254 RepID=A0A2Z3JEZ6_9DEIO|nr:phytanoyl-CoA dioxygenase family protein [Deinococcus irradiatisoli]AWN21970.1 phytanoyl-CoA dioxygenase family protein [Deinococcus irradiatisoli]